MLETNRLLLRPYLPEDWRAVHVYASIPEFSQFDVWGPNSIDDTKEFIAECIKKAEARPILRYELAIVLRESNILVGGCTLKRPSAGSETAALGFAVNPSFQCNGYATEAASALIRFALEELAIRAVFAECDTRNIASRRVMEKAGMQLVKVISDHQEIKGVMTDSYHYEIPA